MNNIHHYFNYKEDNLIYKVIKEGNMAIKEDIIKAFNLIDNKDLINKVTKDKMEVVTINN